MKTKQTTYLLPEIYASALINGDFSGLKENEVKELRDWMEREKPGTCLNCSDYSYFLWHNDINNLGSYIKEFIFSK